MTETFLARPLDLHFEFQAKALLPGGWRSDLEATWTGGARRPAHVLHRTETRRARKDEHPEALSSWFQRLADFFPPGLAPADALFSIDLASARPAGAEPAAAPRATYADLLAADAALSRLAAETWRQIRLLASPAWEPRDDGRFLVALRHGPDFGQGADMFRIVTGRGFGHTDGAWSPLREFHEAAARWLMGVTCLQLRFTAAPPSAHDRAAAFAGNAAETPA